ncbi:MAG TPA: sigma-70 family RNA polymerase sigma factor [Planctomycetota bacterium]|jgi:RNA polymerase sigma-70 factor (ECF subfamily)|nr:sigma-70 family RNA polymerase sigma factor [Planctomycetota bacterium]
MPEPSDEEAVRRALAGDREAFDLLVVRHARAVIAVARHRLRDAASAEDAAQETFLVVYRTLADLRDPARFGAYAVGVAHRVCSNHFRKLLRRPGELVGDVESSSSPVRAAEAADLLDGMPAELREIARLKYLEGHSYPEIGARLGLSFHQIDYALRRARRWVRERLGGERG